MVGSRFCGDVDDSPGDTTKLREVIVRLKLHFLNVIDDGSVVIVSQEREIIAAVEEKHVTSVSLPVDCWKTELANGKTPEARSPRRVLRHAHGAHSRRQCEKLRKIATIKRKIRYEVRGDG